VSMNVADNEEVLEYAAKSGCKFMMIGVESEDPDALKEMDKAANQIFSWETIMHKFGNTLRATRNPISIMGTFGLNVLMKTIAAGRMRENKKELEEYKKEIES